MKNTKNTRKVIDLHCDSVYSLLAGENLLESAPRFNVDVPRLKEGGVALQVFSAYVPVEIKKDKAFAHANKLLDLIDAFSGSDERLAPVNNSLELEDVMAGNKTGIMKAVENGLAIEDSLSKLEHFRRRNVRIMALVHSRHLPWISSCTDFSHFRQKAPKGEGRGLNRFGEMVVDAMNDLGIIPDLSHASYEAFFDILKRVKKPLIASHSSVYTLCPAERNLKDSQLRALGDSGGLVGVNFFSAFLSRDFLKVFSDDPLTHPDILSEVMVPPSLIADHIDYIVRTAGEDCVAFGSDFDGIPAAPKGIKGSDCYPLLEKELVLRGYSEKRLEKIFNGNFLRVLKAWD